jgi:hypothetical protein
MRDRAAENENMRTLTTASILAICVGTSAIAQTSPPPQKLPPSVSSPSNARPTKPLSASEVTQKREAEIRALKEEIRSFDNGAVEAVSVGSKWIVRVGNDVLKDFGGDRGAAFEAARVIKDLRINQLGTIPGSQPPFEYWLVDGKAPSGANSRVVIIPIFSRTIRAEQVGGTWMLTDGAKGIYDFGSDTDAVRRAELVFWKYGFNQLGVVGNSKPMMIYPLTDPRRADQEKISPPPNAMPLGVLTDAARTSVLLPGNVYGGRKSPFDLKKLEVLRLDGQWQLVHDGATLGRFGTSESLAKSALKVLKDARPTEIARIGDGGFPIFLSDGLPLRCDPLGVTRVPLRADRMKVQKVRETFWLFEELRPVMEVGSKADAELLLKVIRFYDLRTALQFGRPDAGGLWVLTAAR